MAFPHLVDHLREDPGVSAALAALERRSVVVPDLPVSARNVVAAVAAAQHRGPVLTVASRADRAESLAAALAEYCPELPVLIWPAPEALPFEQLPFTA
jgi:hypothetical protein